VCRRARLGSPCQFETSTSMPSAQVLVVHVRQGRGARQRCGRCGRRGPWEDKGGGSAAGWSWRPTRRG
jgi:hypothetical protein